MKTIGGIVLQEESDNEDEVVEKQNTNQNSGANSIKQKLKTALMTKYKDLFDQIKLDEMRFQRGSICTNKEQQQCKESLCSDSFLWKNPNNTSDKRIGVVERAILYHLATKIIAEDYRVVQ